MYSQSIEEGNSVKNWLVTNLNQISVQCLLPFQSYIWKKMQSIFESFLNTCEERLNSKNPKLRRILSRINPNSQPIVSRVNRYHYTDNVAGVLSQRVYSPYTNQNNLVASFQKSHSMIKNGATAQLWFDDISSFLNTLRKSARKRKLVQNM